MIFLVFLKERFGVMTKMTTKKITCFDDLPEGFSAVQSSTAVAGLDHEPSNEVIASLKKKVSSEFYKEFLESYADSYGEYEDTAAINKAHVEHIAMLVAAGVGEDIIRKLPAHSGNEYLLCREFIDIDTFVNAYRKYRDNTHLYLYYNVTPFLELLIKNNKADWLPKCSAFPEPLQKALVDMGVETALKWAEVIMESNSCFANFSFLTDCSMNGGLNSFDLLLGEKISRELCVQHPAISFNRLNLDYSKLLWVRLQMDNRLYKFPLYRILKDSLTFEEFREDHSPRYLIACYGKDDTISIVLSKFPVEIKYSNIDYSAGQCFDSGEINPVEKILNPVFGEDTVNKPGLWKLPFVYNALLSDRSWLLLIDKPGLLVLVPWYSAGDTLNITMTKFLCKKVSSEFAVGDYNALSSVSGEVINLYDLFDIGKRNSILKRLSEGDINDYKTEKI